MTTTTVEETATGRRASGLDPTPLNDAALLARLVSFDSTSRNSNLPIADAICAYLDLPGIRIERNPSHCGTKTNLVVEVGPATAPSRDGLMLSGHMDVVPADEPEWTSDPFELVDQDDRFVGRGACDMKGFVALALNTAVRWSRQADALRAPLALVLTFDEEIGTLGARHFVDTWDLDARPLPRRSIIGEPTSMQAVRLHKGHATARLEVRGTPSHSGYPHLGHSAIEPMARACVALAEIGADLRTERPPHAEHFPEVPFVALNLARIQGGSAINIVPDHCRLDIGYRILPDMREDSILDRMRTRLEGVLDGEDWSLDAVNASPPMLLPEDHDLHRAVCALGGQTETVSASYATDGGWLGRGGFDCVVWGPGDIGVAHKPNEWMPKDEFTRCAEHLDLLVRQFCIDSVDSAVR